MRKYSYFYVLLIAVFLFVSCNSSKEKIYSENDIAIIPTPKEKRLGEGSFTINNQTKIIVPTQFQESVTPFVEKLKKSKGISLTVENNEEVSSNYIKLVDNNNDKSGAYKLSISKDGITINSGSYNGFLYGLETVAQLLPNNLYSENIQSDLELTVPVIEINDEPRFEWRGLMLDVSRHFFEKEYVMQTIDRLAMHKMNVLHLHLVDDQGWRIEIKKYPNLTKVGAWRVDQEDKHWNDRRETSANEEATYGGFYTQKDIKEIVAYATEKGVTVVPEIEMPAHVSSAIAAYPHLSCNKKAIGVPSGGLWPITDIYCAGQEATFDFLEDVLLEFFELFPSKYIHVGGDEATKTNWKKCPDCQRRIKEEGLKDVEELQSYFITRMEKFINDHDRVLIGWDEILEGGLAPNATVMSWRGVKGGVEAADQGHDVVMTPGTHVYFDYYQGPQDEEPLAIGGYTPLSKVYQFDPVVESMTEEEANHVLGGQANLWSEYIPTNSHSEYMIFPRLAALSEVLWTPKANLDWDDFSQRLKTQFSRYDHLGINYAKSSFLITPDAKVDIDNELVTLALSNEYNDTDIRYALNDEPLNKDSKKYSDPIELKETTAIRASVFQNDKMVGKIFTDTIDFHKATAHKVEYLNKYSDSYQGSGEFNLVNTLRGTTNFHDGKWQGWFAENMDVIIDLNEPTEFSQVIVGSMDNQGPDIYLPVKIEVFISNDQQNFTKVGEVERAYEQNANPKLYDFKVDVGNQKAQYIKVIAHNYDTTPKDGATWLFVDEIIVK